MGQMISLLQFYSSPGWHLWPRKPEEGPGVLFVPLGSLCPGLAPAVPVGTQRCKPGGTAGTALQKTWKGGSPKCLLVAGCEFVPFA